MHTYELQHGVKTPLYEQLYRAIKADILSGVLTGGEKLPSKRALSEHLGLSKITVEAAYAQLLAEGYITSRQCAGYYVEHLTPIAPSAQTPAVIAPHTPLPARQSAAARLFPFSVWARLMRGVLLDQSLDLLQPVPNTGLPALRCAIARHLQNQRGMRVSPEQVIIGAGAEYFYNLLVQFLGRDRIYAAEDPGHRKLMRVYRANGVQTRPIAMDADGVLPELLDKSHADVLHICPSHHYPTGTVMPIGRRQALMRWLSQSEERYLIEDDYDSEFRFSGLPIPSMQSMDRSGRVIYMNTFSKTIAPALRISYMILPAQLLARWQQTVGFYSCSVPSFEQMTLTRFLDEGYFEKHLNRMKKHYRTLRTQLLQELAASACADRCTVHDSGAGLHFVLEFSKQPDRTQLLQVFDACGLHAAFLSDFYSSPPPAQAQRCIVFNYADCTPEQFRQVLEQLAQLL